MSNLRWTNLLFACVLCAPASPAPLVNDPDANDDGIVNAIDLGLLRACFYADPVTDSACAHLDFDGDGNINAIDLGRLKSRFFETMPTPQKAAKLYDYLRMPVGVDPNAVAVADLNGSGRMDVLAATQGTLTILLQDPYGDFELVELPGSSYPIAANIHDMNADQALDLIVADTEDFAVLVYLGDGAGGFQPPLTTGVAPGPGWLEIADIDGDGDPDVITSHFSNPHGASVLLNDGSGGLTNTTHLTVWDLATSVAVCDVDKDDRLDLILTGFAGFELFFFYGLEGGGFSPVESWWIGYQFTVHCEDLDGNELPDLIMAKGDGIEVRLADAESGFAAPVHYATGYECRGVLITDVTDDEQADLVCESRGSDPVAVFPGLGGGQFAAAIPSQVGPHPIRPAVADMNGDDRVDLILAHPLSDSVSIAVGDNSGAFDSNILTLAAGTLPTSVTAADVNADEHVDLLTTDSYFDQVIVSHGLGDGSFEAPQLWSTPTEPDEIVVADLDDDRVQDLVIAAGGYGFLVMYGTGDGEFETALRYADSDSAAYTTLVVDDFNGDGHLDVAGSRSFRTSGNVAFGDGQRGFSAPFEVDFGTQSHDLVSADFNGDELADLAAVDTPDDILSVVLGNGDGTFGSPTHYATGDYATDIAAADVSRDGRVDLVVACPSGSAVSVFLGTESSTFERYDVAFQDGAGPLSVHVGEINGDDYPDLLTGNAGSDDVSVLLGNGDGGFQAPVAYPAYDGPAGLADLNGDGRLDIASVHTELSALAILLQRPSQPVEHADHPMNRP